MESYFEEERFLNLQFVVLPDDLVKDNPSMLQLQYDESYHQIVMMQLVYRLDCFYK